MPDPDPLYYVVTLSNLTMVYKGLVQAEHLADFYPDLRDERMTSSIGICHQRFSTNTLPRWNYAQPFRYLAHNGEINSVNANRDWANARAGILHSPLLPSLEDLSHLVNGDGSDSSSLDNLMEVFLAGGMDMFRAMRLMLAPGHSGRHGLRAQGLSGIQFDAPGALGRAGRRGIHQWQYRLLQPRSKWLTPGALQHHP